MKGANIDVGAFEVVMEEGVWDSVYAVQQDVVGQLLLYNNIIVNNYATIGNLNTIPNNGTNLYQDTNNIFVSQNNYKLASNSLAIDAGDNQYVNFSKDLNGDTRIVCGYRVDQGAFEVQPENYAVSLTAHTVMDVTCSGHVTTLTASGGERYTWSHSNETSNTVTVNPLVPACYTVTAYRDHVCQWSDTATICINPDEMIENSMGSPSTAGKRFWVSFMRNHIGNPALSLLISSQTNCTGTVTNPNTGWSVSFSVIANETTRLAIPNDQAYCHSNGTVLDRGLLVTSTDNISLYASNFRECTYDVCNVLPETALSDEYVAQAYTPLKNTEFLIVATADSTEVEITPSCRTSDDHHAYVPYTVMLNQGQAYQVISKFGGLSGDLSGSVIRTSDIRKPIAVFNGNVCANVPSGNRWCDHVVEQAFGTRFWGRQFVVTNTVGMPYDRIKVTAADDNTRLVKDGIPIATLNAHQTYEFELTSADTACFLESSKACAAYLYVAGSALNSHENYRGDPSMVWISPLEQRINEITFATFDSPNLTQHYVNIVSPAATVRSVRLDNNYVWDQFRPVASNPMYEYARIKILNGTHTLSSDGGIVAHVYGTGYCETYAYSVGSKAAVLSEQMFVNQVLNAELENNEFCTYEDIIFDAIVNYQCDSVIWDFGDGTGNYNGYHFTHHYTQAGTYPVSMTVFLYDNFGQHCTTLYSQMVIHDGYNVIFRDTVCQGVYYQGYGFDHAADSAGLITLTRTVEIPDSECDSTYVLELFVVQGVFDYYDTICAGNDYSGYGFQLLQAASGAYLLTDTVSRTPCDSVTVLHLLVTPRTNDIYGIHGMEYVCPGNTYTYWLDTLSGLTGIEWTFPDEAHVFSGQGTDHITVTFTESTLSSNITATGANSCGTASFTMTVFPQPVHYITIEDTVCGIGRPYHKYGFDIDSVTPNQQVYIHNMLSESCCDSTIVLSLLIVDLPDVVIQADTYQLCHNDVVELTAVCQTESMDWVDTLYNVSLTYLWNTGDTAKTILFSSDTSFTASVSVTNDYGCSVFADTLITIFPIHHAFDTLTICESLLPYTYADTVFEEGTVSGDFVFEGSDIFGCDSLLMLHFTVNISSMSDTDVVACASFTWYDSIYTQSGDYTTYLTAANGCDSIVTLHLTVNHPTVSVDERDVCDSLRWIDGNLYTESTETATFTQTNAAGCDSIITLHLTVNHPTAGSLAMAVMENDLPYELNGETYNQSGVYIQHLTSTAGCDSTLTLQLTVYNNQTLMMDSAVCENELPLTWNDSVFTSAGTKTRIYPASNGTDSTVVMNLTVLPNPTAADTMVLYATMLPYYLALADTLIPASIPGPLHLFYWDTAATGCDTLVSLVVLIEETQPLAVSVEGTENTDCYGVGCEYHGPTILINEVALIPSTGDGSIAGSFDTYAGEWLELYNPHKCESVDISCYFLGNNAKDYNPTLTAYGGGFTLPQGTVVPPQGFCLVRGVNAPAVPSNLLVQNGGNVVEVVVNSRYCFGDGTRLWFPNAGGWFAFYDANGVVQDAIYWADSTNFCSTCPPCVSSGTGCGFSGTLASFSQIPYSKKNYIGNNLTQGQSLRRVPDGGSWSTQSVASTYATCNDTCVDPPVITCNAIAVAHVSGGVAPYTYLWNDFLLQTTDTATGLCAGTYAVTVTDALGDTAVAQVTIENFVPQVSHNDILACLSDSLVVLQGLPAGGTYTGGVVMGDTLALSQNVPEYQMTYTYVNEHGCAGSAQFHVNVSRNVREMDTVVCSSELPFLWHGQSLTAPGTYRQSTPMDSVCDSLLVLHLSVVQQPQLMVDQNVVIEPGASATLHVSGASSYLWTPAIGLSDTTSASPVASPAQSTLYYVTGFTSDFCSSMDSVRVLVIQYVDTTICENELPLNWFGLTFLDTTVQTLTVTHENALPEVFQLQVHLLPVSYSSQHDTVPENNLPASFNGLFFADDVDTVLIIPNSYGCDSIINYSLYVCHNQTVTVDSTICESDLPLFWNDQVLPCAGEYQAELQTSCGSDSLVSLHLSVIDTSVRLSSLTDNFCDELMAELEVESPMTNYVWSTGETSPNITVNLPGRYSVTASQGDCRNMAEILIENCDIDLYLPNAITPVHSNGLNDYFAIPEIFQQDIRRFEIRIYNRWGELVFYSTDKNFKWNGEYKGQIYHNSMYNYIIQYTDKMGRHQIKGSIMVL